MKLLRDFGSGVASGLRMAARLIFSVVAAGVVGALLLLSLAVRLALLGVGIAMVMLARVAAAIRPRGG